MQRGRSIYLQVVSARDRETLHGFLRENLAGDVEAIYTDDWEATVGSRMPTPSTKPSSIRRRNTFGATYTRTLWRTSGRCSSGPSSAAPPREHQAPRRLFRRAGVPVQQPREPAHVPRRDVQAGSGWQLALREANSRFVRCGESPPGTTEGPPSFFRRWLYLGRPGRGVSVGLKGAYHSHLIEEIVPHFYRRGLIL